MRRLPGNGSVPWTKLSRSIHESVIAAHKRPGNDDNPRIIGETRQYILRLRPDSRNDGNRAGALRQDAGALSKSGSTPGGHSGARRAQPNSKLALAMHEHLNLNCLWTSYYAIRCSSMGKSNRESKAASIITGRNKAQVIHNFIFSKH